MFVSVKYFVCNALCIFICLFYKFAKEKKLAKKIKIAFSVILLLYCNVILILPEPIINNDVILYILIFLK